MSPSVKFNEKEVKNPFLRFLVVILVFIGMILIVCVGISLIIVTHPILRILGRKGNIRPNALALDRDSFRKA